MTDMAPRQPTIRDVARVAAVSSSAVSKVLNNGYGVSRAMREKVERAAQELGYRPKPGARALRGRSYTIGVLLGDMSAPSMPVIVEGIHHQLGGTPLQVLLSSRGPHAQHQQRSIETLVDHQMDGLILIAPVVPSAYLEELGLSVPLVVIARHGQGLHYDTVVDDDRQGALMMVEHLVGLGHRRIAHITEPLRGLKRPSVLPSAVRADGYEAGMRAHGLEPWTITTSYTEEGGYKAAMKALSCAEPPTAIFAGADIAALGVLRAADELGLRVPEDLTVTGSDNLAFTRAPQISLTTADSSGNLTGATSARLLLERIEGRESPVAYSIAPRLIVRGTSGPPRRS